MAKKGGGYFSGKPSRGKSQIVSGPAADTAGASSKASKTKINMKTGKSAYPSKP